MPVALKWYEREMWQIVAAKQEAGRKFACAFLPASPGRLWVRNLSLRFADFPPFAPIIRRQFGFGEGVKL